MQQIPYVPRRLWKRRAMSLLLALVMILGLVPGLPGLESTASAHWADPYLSQMVEWGFIRADQAENPNRALTRADFMAITNRAYGYHETGETPFEDVAENDWFYDDVGIAYTARYIKGTSPTTASPNNPLTRETAATILGRNMMLQESPGELLDFTDARQISNWARGVVKSSLEHYLVSGYEDGTFRPQRNVSWGEMAAMVTKLVGTPLQEPGDYSLGGVFGNVTITSPDVTLRDTVISGDLYISGGVGLGGIKLENVTVLGRIIACGTGQSEGGGASILLRNVTADELLIDNLQDNFVTLQADGITEIGRTTVRTSAYIEDNTPDGMGLKYISIEGETFPEGEEPDDWEPMLVQLAGRIEEVVNRTPQSTVQVGRGTVAKLTVDEAATDSNVIIDRGAVVKELNLDTATIVTGEGDIEHLVVNAPGCEVEMLPDKIDIRPGITAIIAGEEMDTVAAEESSMDPMILAGYPQAQDIIPTGLDAVFMTNKAGTIYWAVSAITDGSIGEEDLIKPPSYGNLAVRNGSTKVGKGNEEVTSKISGLTPGGSYYLSAVLVDARDQRSATKVISFTTPDNTVPAFCDGYPYMSSTSRTFSQVVVMPTKDCKLYYALLPKGAAAPTENELKTSSVSGALGYGVQDVYKNVESAFQVNDVTLEEQETYVLYLWLTDADGANKGKITTLTFTTNDETLPYFLDGYPVVTGVQATSVKVTFRTSEDGTVFWTVVPADGTAYPRPKPGEAGTAPLDSDYAKLQVASGLNAFKFGKVSAKEATDGVINITGLTAETTYMLYCLIQDKAGNYSQVIKEMTINTLDTNGPKVRQTFSKVAGLDDTVDPMPDTDIILTFSENICSTGPVGGDFLSLYEATQTAADKNKAMDDFVNALRYSIKLYQQRTGAGRPSLVNVKGDTGVGDDWTIDYSKATVKNVDGEIVLTFPSDGLQLDSGGTYYFEITNLTDNASKPNKIVPGIVDYKQASISQGHNVPRFTVVFAQVYLEEIGLPNAQLPTETKTVNGETVTTTIEPDSTFRMTPLSTKSVDDGIAYDILLWTDTTIKFDLYYRAVGKDGTPHTAEAAYAMPNMSGKPVSGNGWVKLGDSGVVYAGNSEDDEEKLTGISLHRQFNGCNASNFPDINTLDDSENIYYEFALFLTQKDKSTEKDTWSGDVHIDVYVAAGTATSLNSLANASNAITFSRWKDYLSRGLANSNGAVSIATTDSGEKFLPLRIPFTDTQDPNFRSSTPTLKPGDTFLTMDLNVDRACKIYYVVAPVGDIATEVNTAPGIQDAGLLDPDVDPAIPTSGSSDDPNQNTEYTEWVLSPDKQDIWKPPYKSNRVKTGTIDYEGGSGITTEVVRGLMSETDYFAYFVLEGASKRPSKVYLYTFKTGPIENPKIQLDRLGTGVVNVRTDKNSYLDWVMFAEQDLLRYSLLWEPFSGYVDPAKETEHGELPASYKSSDYTVFQALTEPASLNYSIFDLYATQDVRRLVSELIRSGTSVSGTTTTGQGSIHTEIPETGGTSLDTIDARYKGSGSSQEPNMNPETQYIVLSVAYHDNGDKDFIPGLSFKAVDNVFVPNQMPPEVRAVSTVITAHSGHNYSGSVTIEFDKDLYWTNDGARAWSVHATAPTQAGGGKPADGPGTTDANRYKELINYLGGSAVRYLSLEDAVRSSRASYTIYFNNMPAGANLVLFDTGDICNNSANRNANNRLRVSFVERLSGNDPRAGFTGTWDGDYKTVFNLGTVMDTPILDGDIDIILSGKGVTGRVNTGYSLNLNNSTNTCNVSAILEPDPGTKAIYEWSIADSDKDVLQFTTDTDGTTVGIKALSLGTRAKVTFSVTTGAGNTSYQYLYVTVTANPEIELVTNSTENGVDFKGTPTDDGSYAITWSLQGNVNPSATLKVKGLENLPNTKVAWASSANNIVTATTPGQSTTLQVMGRNNKPTIITASIGPDNIKRTITVTIISVTSQSGLVISGTQVT